VASECRCATPQQKRIRWRVRTEKPDQAMSTNEEEQQEQEKHECESLIHTTKMETP
jgi:hypothetical protein